MATTTSRSMRRGLQPAVPMPYVPALEELYRKYGNEIFCRGQLVMLSGRRGSQKSGAALWLVHQWDEPTLYVNGDMSAWTANSRVLSITSGLGKDEVKDILREGGARRDDLEATADDSRVLFLHSSRPALEEIDEEVDAFVEAWDAYPPVVVIDNLMDVEPLLDGEFENLVEILQQLKNMAHETDILVMVLHHNKDDGNSAYPAPIEGLKQRVGMTPEVVLSIALENQPGQDEIPFRISVTKQREGRATPKADDYATLIAIPDRTDFRASNYYQQSTVPAPPAGEGNTWGT